MRTNILLLIGSIFLAPFHVEVLGLQWKNFIIPRWVLQGTSPQLKCEFDLEGEKLYCVKWYKESQEIYRFFPGDKPVQAAFEIPGVNIDVGRSSEYKLTLLNANSDTSGRYKCEVLTEGPLFTTLVMSSTLNVVVPPSGPLTISGGKEEYKTGDLVDLTCQCPDSFPPANLTWFINGQKAPDIYIVRPSRSMHHDVGRRSLLHLKFIINERHFVQGSLTFQCVGEMPGLVDLSAMHIASQRRSLMPALLGDSISGEKSLACPCTYVLLVCSFYGLYIRKLLK